VATKSADNVGHGERGTASVELVAAVPFLLLALAVAAQIALAGQALWSASVAARAGAHTVEVASSHVAMISHPHEVTELIIAAAQA